MMTKVYCILFMVLYSGPCTSQTNTENYVMSTMMLSADGSKGMSSVQYYNGLGYPTVAISTLGSRGQTAGTLTTYDASGREQRRYAPVPAHDLEFMSEEEIHSGGQYYEDNSAYTQSHYDALDRITGIDIAGDKWTRVGKQDKVEYSANALDDNVRVYHANPNGRYSLVNSQKYYPSGSLSKVVSFDADDNKLETYKDLFGKVILQRGYDGYTQLDTYYVYDDLDRLCYVLSPQYQIAGTKEINCYEYRYDERGRVVKKFLPQCEYIQYWYDNTDRVTFMQDANLRKQGRYRFMLYDHLGRMAVQGTCKTCRRNQTDCPVVTHVPSETGICGTGYVCSVVGLMTDAALEVANYYDQYDFLGGPQKRNFAFASEHDAKATGFLTGSIIATSNKRCIYSILHYNEKGLVSSTESNTLEGGVMETTTVYTFTNNSKLSTYNLFVGGKPMVCATAQNDYNQFNDKISQTTLSLAVNGSLPITRAVASYSYDALGRLSRVTRQGNTGSIDYTYDLHGWITAIASNNFKENLYYADGHGAPCYNGNISSLTWKRSDNPDNQGYKFTYDGMNRMTNAIYGERNFTNHANRYNEYLEYDENGNIERLQRHGLKQDGIYGKIDNLHLSINGNQVSSVVDEANRIYYVGAMDFARDKYCPSSCTYNGNGALTSDASRGIACIDYDDLNNPRRIQFVNGNVTEYVYSALGEKLRTVHYTAVPNIIVPVGSTHSLSSEETLYKDSTDYLGSLILENGKPSKYLFNGGYCSVGSIDNTNDSLAFHYFTKDHLGNIRMVTREDGTVEQRTDYYPFGLPYSDSTAKNPNFQKYKYNGKELDCVHGLNTYDYGARQSNSVLGQWDRMDPLCEKYYNISPYAYCGDSPVNAVDPDGREVRDGVGPYNASNSDENNVALKALARDLAWHNDPNSIMIVAHGVYPSSCAPFASSINIMTYNIKTKRWQDNIISNGKELNRFLSRESKTWQKAQRGELSKEDLHIVFYSCGSSEVVRQMSSDDAFKGVTFLAPGKRVQVTRTASSVSIYDKNVGGREYGVWRTIRDGNIVRFHTYSGDKNLRPGTKGFDYGWTWKD